MLVDPGSDEDFFRETTAKYLDERAAPPELRRLRDDPDGFDAAFWKAGADLGWTSLLVSEDRGGGSISGRGLADLSLIAYEFGRHAAPGPLLAANVVASALDEVGDGDPDLLAGLLAGTALTTWCWSEPPPADRLGSVSTTIDVDGGDLVLRGAKRPVESGAGAGHFLVTGRTGTGLTQVLVAATEPGISITPLKSVDVTRRYATVAFDQVRVPATAALGEIGGADLQVDRQVRVALAVANAEAVGAMQAAFDMTVEWAFDRYSFGRPLASYQALKHRFADMKTWLEASHAIADAATAAVVGEDPEADRLLSAAKAFIGSYGSELIQDCVQIHGGLGVTFEHDLHLFLRRHTLDRALYGTPSDHRQRLADLTERDEEGR